MPLWIQKTLFSSPHLTSTLNNNLFVFLSSLCPLVCVLLETKRKWSILCMNSIDIIFDQFTDTHSDVWFPIFMIFSLAISHFQSRFNKAVVFIKQVSWTWAREEISREGYHWEFQYFQGSNLLYLQMLPDVSFKDIDITKRHTNC